MSLRLDRRRALGRVPEARQTFLQAAEADETWKVSLCQPVARGLRFPNLPLMIADTSGRRETQRIDQRQPLEPGTSFRTIATLDLLACSATTFIFQNQDADGFVIIDALQLLLVEGK